MSGGVSVECENSIKRVNKKKEKPLGFQGMACGGRVTSNVNWVYGV